MYTPSLSKGIVWCQPGRDLEDNLVLCTLNHIATFTSQRAADRLDDPTLFEAGDTVKAFQALVGRLCHTVDRSERTAIEECVPKLALLSTAPKELELCMRYLTEVLSTANEVDEKLFELIPRLLSVAEVSGSEGQEAEGERGGPGGSASFSRNSLFEFPYRHLLCARPTAALH